MISVIRARIHQKHRTMGFPDGPPPPMPNLFQGRPLIDTSRCPDGCRVCAEACPADAMLCADGKQPVVDLGRCLFCNDCTLACPHDAIHPSKDYRLAVRRRHDLVLAPDATLELAEALGGAMQKLLGRSLKLREVSAGGCNACEADVNVLGTPAWDLGRFGIQFVASPRHADGVLITGPVTQNMETALRNTYDAVPAPKIVIAVGACALSGGLYRTHGEVHAGAEAIVPVDLFIPGCPPHPLTILDGLLRLVGRLER